MRVPNTVTHRWRCDWRMDQAERRDALKLSTAAFGVRFVTMSLVCGKRALSAGSWDLAMERRRCERTSTRWERDRFGWTRWFAVETRLRLMTVCTGDGENTTVAIRRMWA
uniref:(northern house mosquito) hypothetical protein n=1 Tax=Culex pipiens TaxID=7175 RepID=A0A8D8DF43_CULPI